NMGMEPFWITSSLLCVIAQKLVRKIHADCSREDLIPEKILAMFPEAKPGIFKRGQGCAGCLGSGYSGRIGIYELFVPDKDIEKMILDNAQDLDILNAARMSGMKSMMEDGFQKAAAGLTTLDEVIRVAPPKRKKEGQKPSFLPQSPQKGSEPVSDSLMSLDASQKLSLKDRILVIDDDEAILRLIKKILTGEFYEVVAVSHGQEGLYQVFKYPPDLILVDYNMPGMNGLDFIKKLKDHSKVSKIPVIMLTASPAEETEIKALNMGADDWISKPIHKERLLARIKRLLKK
ncbi:MAG: hypothetical protein DRH26_19405, partial [Deltaproteobacteria bacterium]